MPVREPGDEVLVGNGVDDPKASSPGSSDQLAVRRGNTYYLSNEVPSAQASGALTTNRELGYGNPDDTVFVAALRTGFPVDPPAADSESIDYVYVYGDGLGVRRVR